MRALSFFRSQTNSDFIFASVDKELRVNPRPAAGLCSTKVNVLSDLHSSAAVDPQQACRKPRTRTTSSVGDKQDTRESHGDVELKDNVSSGP